MASPLFFSYGFPGIHLSDDEVPALDISELIHDDLFEEEEEEEQAIPPNRADSPAALGAVTAPPSTQMRGEKRQRDSAVPEPATTKRPRLGHAQKVSAPTAKQPRRRHLHEGYPSASLDVTQPYACPLDGCKVSVVATKSAMNKHLRTCHDLKGMTTDSEGRISCPLCDKKMKPGSLGRHILEVEMDAEVWRCAVEECTVKMARKTSMERHIRELHSETRDTAAPQPTQGGCSHSGIKGDVWFTVTLSNVSVLCFDVEDIAFVLSRRIVVHYTKQEVSLKL
ncbi:hypothetical protein B0H21DRAFT_84855 [Amylocystis lapponica]|nr:hypothetical protein B0H21DRAFT_84855 [Amylocystis lapponica]